MNEVSGSFDFLPIGQAIKKARENSELTREQLAELLNITPRHLQSIENEGQHPSFQLFVQLISMFHISADQYIFSDKQIVKDSLRRQIDSYFFISKMNYLLISIPFGLTSSYI